MDIQDTIEFSVNAETTVVSDTVKLIATIAGIVGDKPEAETRDEIKAMMAKLVPDAEWQFSNQNRSNDATGYERLTLTASARVSEKHNHALDERIKEVSRKGLSINAISVDTSIPADMIEKGERELRSMIVAKVMSEQEALCAQTKRAYRISLLRMGNIAATMHSNSRGARGGSDQGFASASAATMKQAYGSGFDEEGTLGNASKLTMSATVVLGVPIDA